MWKALQLIPPSAPLPAPTPTPTPSDSSEPSPSVGLPPPALSEFPQHAAGPFSSNTLSQVLLRQGRPL